MAEGSGRAFGTGVLVGIAGAFVGAVAFYVLREARKGGAWTRPPEAAAPQDPSRDSALERPRNPTFTARP